MSSGFFSAIDDEMITYITSDPATSGYGIRLVYRFGKD